MGHLFRNVQNVPEKEDKVVVKMLKANKILSKRTWECFSSAAGKEMKNEEEIQCILYWIWLMLIKCNLKKLDEVWSLTLSDA